MEVLAVEGDITKVEGEIKTVEENIMKVEEEIKGVEREIEDMEVKRDGGSDGEKQQLLSSKKDLLVKKVDRLGKREEQLRKKEEQLRQEKEQLRKKEEQLRDQQLSTALQQKECYIVKATFFGAKQRKGIRASVFRYAQMHCAYYDPMAPSQSIWYDDSSDLQITLFFVKLMKAMKFQNFLTMWYINNPIAVKEADVSVEKVVGKMYVEESSLRRVFLSDYNFSVTDSPVQTLEEFLGHPSSSSAKSSITFDDPLVEFQSIETPSYLKKCRPYKMHIKPRARFPKLVEEPNNILIGSWTPCHQFFDGLKTDQNIPQVAIRPVMESDFTSCNVGNPPHKRQRVEIILEFRDLEAAQVMVPHLKLGSVMLSDTEWKTNVLVLCAKTFCECLKWKYEETTTVWKEHDVED